MSGTMDLDSAVAGGTAVKSAAGEPAVARGLQMKNGSTPSHWQRLRLRMAFEVRKRLGGLWMQICDGVPIPLLPGMLGYLRARSEVLGQINSVNLAKLPPPADAVKPSDIPSVRRLGTRERVLAEIDQDGFAFAVDPDDATFFNRRAQKLTRKRYRLDVVMRCGSVYLRKQFVKQPLRDGLRAWLKHWLGMPFYNEAACLLRLRTASCAPLVREVDPASQTLYMDYLRGNTLRHEVAERGVTIHDLDLGAEPQLAKLTGHERDSREMELFAGTIASDYRDKLKRTLLEVNERGVAPLDIKLGNVLVGVTTGALYWLDYERAALRAGPRWKRHTETQHALANRWFGLDFVTRDTIATYAERDDLYSPVDFGRLGHVGDISNVETGEGRWRWLLSQQTDWRDKRILDLGSNNCLYAVRALQAGAREVHCVERDAGAMQQASLVRSAAEQLESRPLNLHLHNTDIASFLEQQKFADDYFDISMALCSIYYLSDDQIARCMRVLARVSRQCWLQANIWTERQSPDLLRRATVEYLAARLNEVGFSDITLIAPQAYRRPLLIGRRPSA